MTQQVLENVGASLASMQKARRSPGIFAGTDAAGTCTAVGIRYGVPASAAVSAPCPSPRAVSARAASAWSPPASAGAASFALLLDDEHAPKDSVSATASRAIQRKAAPYHQRAAGPRSFV